MSTGAGLFLAAPLLAGALALTTAGPVQSEVRTYPVGLTDLDVAARVVQPLLSPGGVVVQDRRNNRLIVSDRPEAHARVAAALRGLDQTARNVRIVVTHEAERLDNRTAAEASAGAQAGGVYGGVGRQPPRRGVDVRAEASRTRTTSQTREELLVLSGSKASIQVAEQIPYADWFWSWGAPLGLWSSSVQWRDVGTSLVVEPMALGDGRLRIRLTPAFSYFLDRDRQVTEIQQLATEVVVREGETIEVGGVPMADRQFLERFLVGFDRSGTTQRMRITLKATVE
jgi:type II secretory pathway component GspD/PulD (secretin)